MGTNRDLNGEEVNIDNIDLHTWNRWYYRIVEVFGYKPIEDQRAADILSGLLQGKATNLQRLHERVFGKPVLIFGAGPSLESDVQRLLENRLLHRFTIVTADGATTALIEIAKTVPSIVVTDLDGRIQDLFRADEAGAIIVVHAHGDNIPRLLQYVPSFTHMIGTTQVEPRDNVYNFGGFTDGDRAVFLTLRMNPKIIILAGMDFGEEIGQYSKTKIMSVPIKRLKLKMGRELLEWLAQGTDVPLYDITGQSQGIQGYKKVSLTEVSMLL